MTTYGTSEMVMLDACCLLNLCASGHVDQVLQALPMDFGIAVQVTHETLYVLPRAAEDEVGIPEPVDLSELVRHGLLSVHDIETNAEASSYVAFAVDLDDGEAMTCAIALHRRYAVATDDRKALRVLHQRAPQVRTMGTTDLLRLWAEVAGIEAGDFRQILIDVKERGRFLPRRDDPNRSWWDSVMTLPDE